MSDQFIDIEELGLDSEELRPAEGGMREPPMRGEYQLEVTECEPSTSQAGNRTLVFTTVVVAKADGGATEEVGKDFRQWFSLGSHEYSRRRLKNMLNAIGLPLAGFNAEEAIGKRFCAEIFHEKYEKEDSEGNVREFTNARTRKERPLAA